MLTGGWSCPDLTLRFDLSCRLSPARRKKEFKLLLDWLQDAQIDRVGAFKYEPVRGAAANDLGLSPVAPEVSAIRYKRFMEHCQKISARKLNDKIGKRVAVNVDQGGARSSVGRTTGDAPEIDGKVHLVSRHPLRQGDIVTVKIERAGAYDLHGTAI